MSHKSGKRRKKEKKMSKKTAPKADKKMKRISEAELFGYAEEREEAAKIAAQSAARKVAADEVLIAQMQLRSVRSLESDKFGEFTRITLVQPEPVDYNSDGIWKALTPAQRRLAFDENVNLNALPAEIRKKIMAAVTPSDLKAVTTNSLNLDKLAKAVSEEKIEKKVVTKNSSIRPHAPSIRVSHGTG